MRKDALFPLAEPGEIVDCDLVEVNTQLDVGTGITSYLAAHTIPKFLGCICDKPKWVTCSKAQPVSAGARYRDEPVQAGQRVLKTDPTAATLTDMGDKD